MEEEEGLEERRRRRRRRRRRGSFETGEADLLSEIRYPSFSIISLLFGEGAVASSSFERILNMT